jgi:hypothetical protein
MLEFSTWETAPHAMNMATYGLKAVLVVRMSFGRCPTCNDYFVNVINASGHHLSTAEDDQV